MRSQPAVANLRWGRWHMIDEVDLLPIARTQAVWLGVCRTLEALADVLPAWPLGEIPLIDRSLDDLSIRSSPEEEAFFDRLQAIARHTPTNRRLIELTENGRLKRAALARELREELDCNDAPANVASLGYLLRSVFEQVRESLLVDRLAILLLAGDRLSADARAWIIAGIG